MIVLFRRHVAACDQFISGAQEERRNKRLNQR
jgi:hypothetical protein